MDQIEVVARELAETRRTVSATLKAWEHFSHEVKAGIGEDRVRLHAIEQALAGGQSHRYDGGVGGLSIGAQALARLQDDAAFQSAQGAAGRGMKPSQFAARVNVDGSIRAALIGEGTQSDPSGIPSQPERRGFVGPVVRPLRLLDVLPSRPTTADAVEFIKLGATGYASEQDEQGDTKAELDFDGTLARAEIVTIAGWTAASKQVLADHAALQAQIDRVIRHKVLSRLEHQLINGDGTTGKIAGLLHQATTFVPAIGQTPADIIGESLVSQANAGYAPNLILLNPLDWYAIQLTKTLTEGQYIFGSPTVPVPPALWNAAIVTTPSVAEGTGLTVDTSFVTVLDREQANITISNSHSDYFVRNLVAILGELRAGLEVVDESAIFKFDLNYVSE